MKWTLSDAQKLLGQFNKLISQQNKSFNHSQQLKKRNFEASRFIESKILAEQKWRSLNPIQRRRIKSLVNLLKNSWQTKKIKDSFIRVNPQGIHSDEFDIFLNGNKQVYKNINHFKKRQLLKDLQQQNWKHLIDVEDFIQVALALYANAQINRYQFESLLKIHQVKISEKQKNYANTEQEIKFYPLLNDSGNFSDATKSLLIPQLNDYMFKTLTASLKDDLLLVLQVFLKAYPTENFFFTSPLSEDELKKSELTKQLLDLKSIIYINEYKNNEGPIFSSPRQVFLSCLSKDIIRLVYYGIENLFICQSMLGVLDIGTIEKAINHRFRPRASSYPNVMTYETIHGYQCYPEIAAEHDEYHADSHCRAGSSFRKLLNRIIFIARHQLLSEIDELRSLEPEKRFSRGVWQFIDAEFGYFNSKISLNHALDYSTALENHHGNVLFEKDTSSDQITDLGILCFIDMIKNKKIWDNFNFIPLVMNNKFAYFYSIAKKIFPFCESSTTYNILIFHIALKYPRQFLILQDLLKKNQSFISEQIIFLRDNKNNFCGIMNKEEHKKISVSLSKLYLSFQLSNSSSTIIRLNLAQLYTLFENCSLIKKHSTSKKIINTLKYFINQLTEKNTLHIDSLNKIIDYSLKNLYKSNLKFFSKGTLSHSTSILTQLLKDINYKAGIFCRY